MDVVNVIVTCTKDKRRKISAECQLRSLPSQTIKERVADWKGRLRKHQSERVSALELYAGDHWSTVRSFANPCFKIDLWVCSAGYGLIRADEQIVPYGATFSRSHADSVARNVSDLDTAAAVSTWWKYMTQWKTSFGDRPRSLVELFAVFPKRSTIVVTSDNYLRAIQVDLHAATKELADPDLLSIISGGAKSTNILTEYLIPCDARFQHAVGGARRSLNTRLAARIIREARTPPRREPLVRRYRRLLAEQPAIPQYHRQPLSDAGVRRFIVRQLAADGELTHSRLLRQLRDQNMACEQKRFARLYRQIREEMHGS